MQNSCVNARAFSLLELLVALTVCAVVATLVFVIGKEMVTKARQAKCASNLRQIGIALIAYTQDHQGEFPLTSHSLDPATADQAWIFALSEYLGDVDEVRICPADPKGKERLREHGTSYLLNSYLTVPQIGPFGENLGGYTNINFVPEPQTTPIAFPINFKRGVGRMNDHTHSDTWDTWAAVKNDIQPDAFCGALRDENGLSGSANYLFVDGHVENIQAAVVHGWITSGHNFADPESKLEP
ncbi:prepilin-type N-terminal cleavage/methylation domain-containing protein/prepilin-type processing-associated H-X9-DG protein [Roseimicrobium gellanilyticum]|uniref:Prepilin-type N-terminal cleavage/methylation domain-containing protein/prepilin-type processing-associated H-X9-DG protein n=1 Tax=Roseimicrobium gellanilyticum TaxID=748857 RepID=A0A366HV99_9BACT|nr:prepilin-type N-terminal cleavage/methylation domain-containing protein [Roseimicrobium gellanilyticum]RBP48027.1 prepilin-type N-terminal cleavage/methylation domain-containing protein/prepilin-type processing-associated H-X9-DG protein [Roseimicrobium gellanilyticum]